MRRREDRVPSLLHAAPVPTWTEGLPGPPPLDWKVYELPPDGPPRPRPITSLSDETHSGALLLDLGGSNALLIAGSAIHRIPRGEGDMELLTRAAAGAAAWEREQIRLWRRARLPDQFAELSAQLNRATAEESIARVLTDYTVRIVGGFRAFLLLRDRGETPASSFSGRLVDLIDDSIATRMHPRFTAPGIITAREARPDLGMPFSDLAPLFDESAAAMVVHVPVGDEGVLMLAERRASRIMEPEDFTLMRNLAQLADGALLRVCLVDQAHRLSLVDPLTGLANRRQMQILMRHVWASARRGKRFAVVLIDLDDFKEINDTHGHLVGDRILRQVADVLQEEVRGSDLVVRFGGDEYLVVLPDVGADGASALVRRLESRLGSTIRFSAGIAEYHPEFASIDEILAEADRQLYSMKRRNHFGMDFDHG